ncbi:MAG: CRISPR-associated endonuclease Cas1 [Actinomycetia bacterium]|nr:CRISPR-associated endonuclease Cas1 [Actinomycetes bacterium]
MPGAAGLDHELRVLSSGLDAVGSPPAWRGLSVRLAQGDRSNVSPAWLTYTGRTSALNDGHSARKASGPMNTMANYCYHLLEVEAVLARQALGPNPGLGCLHTDKKGRRSSRPRLPSGQRRGLSGFPVAGR